MAKTLIVIAWALFFVAAPYGVVVLCRKSRAAAKVGAILILYFLGLIAGNLLIYPFEGMSALLFPVQDALSSVTIPLALPLILFACDFRRIPVRKALTALVSGLVAVVAVAAAGYFIFGKHLGPEAASMAGMAVGVYTGGTPNLAAVKMMLGVDEGTYLMMNSMDMLVSFVYLIFLMAAGIKLSRRFLRVDSAAEENGQTVGNERMMQDDTTLYRGMFDRTHRSGTLKAVGLAVLVAGAGIGLSMLLTGGINMIVLILTLTTLSIGASFIPAVRSWEKSYDAGMYLVLVFSVVVASMVDVRSLDFASGAWIFAYICFVIFGSLLLQLLFCRLFRVDADTAVITSVAMINSPLFVPMIADSMKNRRVIITGVSAGIIGYALGNYLGVLLASLL